MEEYTPPDYLGKLASYLKTLKPGPIEDTASVEPLLANAWEQLAGHDYSRMTAEKIFGRIESVKWSPPSLRFIIERHGASEMGSSRAELQHWEVDVEQGTAVVERSGRRQLSPMSKPLDVKPIAAEVSVLIIEGREDPRLKWDSDSRVRVLIREAIPEGDAAKQTTEQRRKRFRNRLTELLQDTGWYSPRANLYERQESP